MFSLILDAYKWTQDLLLNACKFIVFSLYYIYVQLYLKQFYIPGDIVPVQIEYPHSFSNTLEFLFYFHSFCIQSIVAWYGMAVNQRCKQRHKNNIKRCGRICAISFTSVSQRKCIKSNRQLYMRSGN